MNRPATEPDAALTDASALVIARPGFPVWLAAVLLALVTLALYWPVTGHDFVNFDDNEYVTDNPHATGGLTWESVRWAFGSGYASNWHPVTWLSHMVDCQLHGLKPWGHHLTSVLLHAINTVLVFLLLRRLTGAFWRSVLVAALFGWHPVHVESVAWVAERKDVLSGFFGLLALVFYARYAQGGRQKVECRMQNPEARIKPDATRNTPQAASPSPSSILHPPSSIFYLLSLFFFALGLMSKPMLVTWPFVLLLLDYWPLRRFELSTLNSRLSTIWRLVREKSPFFALAAVTSVVTFVVQKQGGVLRTVQYLPLGARGGNALVSCCRYLAKIFWPRNLAVFYPHPGYWPLAKVLLAGGLVAGISVLLLAQRRRYPCLLMGWLWFCGTLVPVIGFVQVGNQAMADRYAYLPSLGVLILAIWGAHERVRRWRYGLIALSVAGPVVMVLCLALTRQQMGCWKESETLLRHALAVTENNHIVRNSLGNALGSKGRMDEAIRQYREALRLEPDYAEAHCNLGVVLYQQGRIDEAISQFQESMRLKPDGGTVHPNLGNALLKKGQIDEAISQFEEAIRLNGDNAEAHNNLGNAFDRKGQMDEAIRQYQAAIRLKSDYAIAYNNLGVALGKKGQMDEAIRRFQEAIRLKPDYPDARYNLANTLLKTGRTDEAIRQFQEDIRLKPDDAYAHNDLGAALYQQGRIGEAIGQFQEAVRLKPDYADARRNLDLVLAAQADSPPPPGASTNR